MVCHWILWDLDGMLLWDLPSGKRLHTMQRSTIIGKTNYFYAIFNSYIYVELPEGTVQLLSGPVPLQSTSDQFNAHPWRSSSHISTVETST